MSTSGLATVLQSAICRTKVRHRPAPSMFYFPGLTTDPVFAPNHFPVTDVLEQNFDVILKEYKNLRASKIAGSDYLSNDEHKLHSGKWDWNSYVIKGKRQSDFALQCPKTVEILESMNAPRLMCNTPFSFAFFSTLFPKSNIAAHYGPCNLRIRCHLPLIVPEGDCGMQVGDKIVKWVPGKPLFFDDCYEHKVWNNTDEERVVLLFDIWYVLLLIAVMVYYFYL